MTAEYPPNAKPYPYEHALIIDTLHRVLRAGGIIQAGMPRDILLIKAYRPHTENFQIRLKHRLSQIPCIFFYEGKKIPF